MSGLPSTAVHYVFLLLVDVLEVFRLILGLETIVFGIKVEVFSLEMVEERVSWSCEWVQECVEFIFGAAVVDVVLEFFLLLNHKRKDYLYYSNVTPRLEVCLHCLRGL